MDTTGKKVIVVEDDQFLGELLVKHLQTQGFEVRRFFNAEDCLKEVREIMPHIILLDLLLPGMNGFEFLKIIKAETKLTSIPVVILSNLGQKEEIEEGMKLGATTFLIKANLDLDEIMEKIKQII